MQQARTMERKQVTDTTRQAKLKKPKKIEALTRVFLKWVSLNRSSNTLETYTGRIEPFRKQFGKRRPKSIQRVEIEEYIERVNKRPDGGDYAPDTQRMNIAILEQLEAFALRREYVRRRFIGDHEKPIGKQRERIPKPGEVEAIMQIAHPAFASVFKALRRCGARPNEIAAATVANWKRDEFMIVLEKHKTAKKTGKPRKIVVGTKLEAMILESLNGRTEGPLFRTARGNPWTSDTISQTFARYRGRANVDAELKLYAATRHAFATASYKTNGMDDTKVLMGHAGGMTQRYVHPDINEMRAKQDAVILDEGT